MPSKRQRAHRMAPSASWAEAVAAIADESVSRA
jgi:hypothetical protein